MDRIVVVGASLAGLRAAETLRGSDFAGSLTIIGDEPHRPYDRPPLSKQVLAGEWDRDRIVLPAGSDDRLNATWMLGSRATGLDLDRRVVTLADDTEVPFDGLVIASGARPRSTPGADGIAGVHTLRTIDDAEAIAARLDQGGRVVVVGAGFIGAEVAATCRARGLEVTLVEPLEAPLARVLGPTIGARIADLHRANGVDVRLGVGVDRILGGPDGVEGVVLSDGAELPADVVIIGIGVIPNTEWLEGSGLTLDNGVLCDETTLAAPGVVAAGDVARWPNRRFGEVMRVEHWEHALDMADHAARRLLAGDDGAVYQPVPWFWSDQYDRKIQLAGRPRPDDDFVIVGGDLDGDRFCGLFGRDGQVTAVLAMNMAARVVRYRRAMTDGLAWTQALADAEAHTNAETAP